MADGSAAGGSTNSPLAAGLAGGEALPRWLRAALVACVVAGALLRFTGLEGRLFWYDEVISCLRVSGYTEAEAVQALADGRVSTPEELLAYQRPTGRGPAAVIRGLAGEEPQHPPLYALLLRAWMQLFGPSVAAARALSAAGSLLALLLLGLLCRQTIGAAGALIAVALFAVSPFQLLYAQEAREISLWLALSLLSCILLLRALRLGSPASFALYGLSLLLAMYTSMLSLMLVAAQALYVAASDRRRLARNSRAFLSTAALAGLAFLPWAREFHLHYRTSPLNARTTPWMWQPLPRLQLIRKVAGNLARVFIDLGRSGSDAEPTPALLVLLALLPLALVAWALVVALRERSEDAARLALALVVAVAALLLLPNLLGSGIQSTRTRYLTLGYLGVTLAVARLFASRPGPAWRVALVALLAAGTLSCALASGRSLGRNVDFGTESLETARRIRESARPLLIADLPGASFANAAVLARQLDARIPLQLAARPQQVRASPGAGEIFLYGPSQEFLAGLGTQPVLVQDAPFANLRLFRLRR